MPKNIPGIVQRRGPRQEAPVAIRVQPPQFPVPEPTPSTPSEPSMAPNVAQYAEPMASSFAPSPAPMPVEQYGGPAVPTPSMPPVPPSAGQYAGPMAPATPSLPGIQPQMVPPTQLAATSDVPPVPNKEASPVPANAPLTRRGMLSSRGFMPSVPTGNNPPTPLPSTPVHNPPTPLPSVPVNNSAATLKPPAASNGLLAQNTPAPVGPMAGQQGQPPLARILIELDGKVTGEVLLQKPTLTVGRLGTSDICIPSKRISRHHAQILAEQGTWVMEDAGSVNGLFYNGNHVKRLVFSHGDRVRLAPDVSLVYEVMR